MVPHRVILGFCWSSSIGQYSAISCQCPTNTCVYSERSDIRRGGKLSWRRSTAQHAPSFLVADGVVHFHSTNSVYSLLEICSLHQFFARLHRQSTYETFILINHGITSLHSSRVKSETPFVIKSHVMTFIQITWYTVHSQHVSTINSQTTSSRFNHRFH